MKHRVKDILEWHVTQDTCQHYWMIESASGPISKGQCKFCGVEKEFMNSIPILTIVRERKNPLELPELQGVEFDGEQNKS